MVNPASLRDTVRARIKKGARQDDLELDVAVIGAGVSGLYTGWRLAGATGLPTPPRVQIFEMGSRIGGRLETITLPGMTATAELGGMRYEAAHIIVSSLVKKVFPQYLAPIPFPMGDPATHWFYGRAQRLQANAWTQAQRFGQPLVTNYQLPPELVGWDADQLFNKIIYDVLMADPWFQQNYAGKLLHQPGSYDYTFNLTAQDWDVVKPQLTYCFPGSPYDGMRVNAIGFWNLIRDRAGDEAYEFLAVAGGYYSNTINWNAAEAFPYMVGDFSDAGTNYFTLQGGYDLIAYALADAFLNQPNAAIWTGTRLESFSELIGGDYRYRLTMHDVASGEHWTVRANRIVLALPRRSLELLDQDNFFFNRDANATLQRNLLAVTPEPAFKLLMGFDAPWWHQFGATAGESITDGPMRQCYYFTVDPTGRAILLSSYNDMRTVDFWNPLEPTDDQSGTETATPMMTAEAMREIRLLHPPQINIPDPYVAVFKDWSKDPFGGGYHAWRPGVQVSQVMPYMRKPHPNHGIHICGEAYSDAQGWVEGALCVAERMLEEHFGLPQPEWFLDPNYYMGW